MYLQLRGNMRLRVQKWGNSLALRIPAAFARETRLGPGAEVDLELDGKRLIITPRSHGPFTLSGLLDRVTDENLHRAVDTGGPQGREVW
jgi:antitoxin MazE